MQDGYAMILRSQGQREGLFILLRLAGRSTPMTRTNRSNLSCHTLLFLFVLLGMPMAARCATLEDSARELAHKIAATLPEGETLHCEIQNHSSLELMMLSGSNERSRLNCKADVFVGKRTEAKASIVVTLSENMKNLVWTAEISEGNESHTVFLIVPHSEANPVRSNAPPLNLTRERFWEGVERPLDADTMSSPTGDQLVLLLFRDVLSVRNTTTNSETRINLATEIPMSQLRESSGTILQNEKSVDVSLESAYLYDFFGCVFAYRLS